MERSDISYLAELTSSHPACFALPNGKQSKRRGCFQITYLETKKPPSSTEELVVLKKFLNYFT